MDAPIVQVLFKGRVVQSVPFDRDILRIGRRKDNDIVINNLSVSRSHATLRREGGRIILEDGGSENGCLVNGKRISNHVLKPGDDVEIGRHELLVHLPAPPPEPAAEPAAAPTAPPAAEPAAHATPGLDAALPALKPPAETPDPNDPHGLRPTRKRALPPLESFEDEGGPDEPPPVDLLEPVSDDGDLELNEFELGLDESAEVPADLDPVGMTGADEPDPLGEPQADALAEPEESGATTLSNLDHEVPERTPEPVVEEAPAPPTLYPGLIVHRDGQAHGVVAWDKPWLTVGRSPDCDIVLDQPKVSRRHAVFTRDGDRYEVRDLESVNFTFVNGEKIERRALEPGDVARVEGYEFSFVLQPEPIEDRAAPEPVPAAPPLDEVEANAMTRPPSPADMPAPPAPFEQPEDPEFDLEPGPAVDTVEPTPAAAPEPLAHEPSAPEPTPAPLDLEPEPLPALETPDAAAELDVLRVDEPGEEEHEDETPTNGELQAAADAPGATADLDEALDAPPLDLAEEEPDPNGETASQAAAPSPEPGADVDATAPHPLAAADPDADVDTSPSLAPSPTSPEPASAQGARVDTLLEDEDEDKDLASSGATALSTPELEGPALTASQAEADPDAEMVSLEICINLEEISEPLRSALRAARASGARIPLELRVTGRKG